MAQAAFETKPLSNLFTDPLVADAFRRVERDSPPASVAVEIDPQPVLQGGDVVSLELLGA